MSNISNNLKTLRQNNNLTQAEIAQIAGVTDKAVSTWERGEKEPRMGAIQKLADYFGLRLSDLIDSNPPQLQLSEQESALIQNYRLLDPRGQSAVVNTIQYELAYQKHHPTT